MNTDAYFKNAKKVSSKHLHQVLPHVEQRFIKIRQDEKAGEFKVVLYNS